MPRVWYIISWFNFHWVNHLVLTLGTLGGAFGGHFCLLASGCQSAYFGSSGGPFVSILELRGVFWAGVWEVWWSLWLNFERTAGFIWPAVARVSILAALRVPWAPFLGVLGVIWVAFWELWGSLWLHFERPGGIWGALGGSAVAQRPPRRPGPNFHKYSPPF